MGACSRWTDQPQTSREEAGRVAAGRAGTRGWRRQVTYASSWPKSRHSERNLYGDLTPTPVRSLHRLYHHVDEYQPLCSSVNRRVPPESRNRFVCRTAVAFAFCVDSDLRAFTVSRQKRRTFTLPPPYAPSPTRCFDRLQWVHRLASVGTFQITHITAPSF